MFSQEWISLKTISSESEGYIIEWDGKKTNGFIKFKTYKDLIYVTTDTHIIKIDPLLVKYMHKDSMDFIPLLFNDSTEFFWGVVVDTAHVCKLYQGYAWPKSSLWASTRGGSPRGFNEIHSYLITLDNKDAVTINSFNISKKHFLYAFGENPKIVKYLNSLGKISFNDIPEIVRFVNSLYK